MTPFVGRARELETLLGGIEQLARGNGGLYLLVGPAGIGKTRLADELAASAQQQGVTALWGRCWEGEGAPAFWPWIQVLRSYARTRDDATLRDQLGAGAGPIAELIDDIRRRFPDLPQLPELDAEQQRFRLFDSIATFLTQAATQQPLLVIFDDLHWADTASLRLLHFVMRETGDTRLCVIGAMRDAELTPDASNARNIEALARHGQRLHLHGLNENELGQLIESLEGSKPAPELVRRVYDRTEGNPFFATEILRLWRAEGSPGSEETVPPGVRHTIRRRLNSLSPACQHALAVAAVVGREFPLAMVEPVLRREPGATNDRAALLASMDQARAARLIEPLPTPDRFRFSHALVRETLYEELGSARRARLHAHVGEAIEAAHADDIEPHWAELAHHFIKAGTAGIGERGIDYAVRAAARATRLHAHEDAALHLAEALQAVDFLQPSMPPTAGSITPAQRRCELLVALGEARARAGDVPAAHEAFRLAIDAARRLGAAHELGRAALGLAGADVMTAVDGRAVELLEEALEQCGPKDSPLRARLLSRLANALYFSAARERGARLTAEAVAVAERLGDAPTLALVLGAQRFALLGPDDLDVRVALSERTVALSERAKRKDLLLAAHFWRMIDALEMGNVAVADESLQRYSELADDLRQPYYLWRARVLRAMRLLLRGDFVEAEQLIEETLVWGQRARTPNVQLSFGVQLYELRREQGRLAELEPVMAAFASAQAAIPAFRCGLALLYTHLDRLDDARALFEELAADGFKVLPRDANWLNAMDEVAQVCCALGDRERAALLYDMLLPYARQNVVVAFGDACEGSVSRYLGLLAATLSRWDAAAGHCEEAIVMNRKLRARPQLAHTQREYARVLRARAANGDVARAREVLTAAAAMYEELGMTHYLSLARAALDEDESGITSVHADAAPAAPPNAFIRQGEVWSIAYAGTAVRLRDTRGLHYLAHLLRHPGRDWHVFDLASLVRRDGDAPADGRNQLQRANQALHGGPDARAKAAYAQRLTALRDEVEDAERCNDAARAAAARREVDLVTAELGKAYRLGAPREPNEPLEKARKAVSNRLRAALGRLDREHPELGRHLTLTVRIGTYCSYRPEHPPDWQLD